MFKRFSLLASAILLIGGETFAQAQPCATDHHHQEMIRNYPQLAEFERQFNDQVSLGLAAKTTATPVDTEYYDVPLVVHVVHDYGTEYLADDAIYDAATEWALAFVMANPDTSMVIEPFKQYIGNARLRMHLATIDPDGNPTKGVVHHHSYLTVAGSDQSKIDPWPNNKYINIYFTKTLGTSGAAAYAYYPSSAAFMPWYDGVIGLSSYLNTSKTIPHELGHVLNLQHVWGNNNNAGVACGNDQVDDTPPTKGHTPGCVAIAVFDTTCASGYAKTYLSSTGLVDSLVNYPDTTNAQNIMDYTYCSNMFTKGQCVRMRTAITSSTAGRNNLISAANVAATGVLAPMPDLPPIADYTMNRAVGTGVVTDPRSLFLTFNNDFDFSFRNTSWNDTISSINWQFSNGPMTPVSSSTTTVTNSFSVPGWVTVTLTATSNAGTNTLVDDHAVYAADTAIAGGLGYSQSFADEASVLNWPMFNYYKNQFSWGFYPSAGMGGNGCLKYSSYDNSSRRSGTANGDYDDIVTPAFNLEGISGDLYLNFFTAAASTTSGISGSTPKVMDSMQIDVSTTGGVRWTKIAGIKRSEIVNNGNLSAEFIPGATANWAARAIPVPATYRTNQTFFRLRYRPGNAGNNLYVDNLSISNLPADVQELANAGKTMVIYPNPSSTGCNIAVKTGHSDQVSFVVRDMAGKVVYQVSKQVTPNSVHTEFISRNVIPSAGLYFVTLSIDGFSKTQKMVIY